MSYFTIQALGALLEERRKLLGLSVAEVSEASRIRAKYIVAIERGEEDNAVLPTTYSVGYVRIYADLLGLNGAELIKQLKESNVTLQQAAELHIPECYQENSHPSPIIILSSIILLLLIYGVGYYSEKIDHSYGNKISAISNALNEFPFLFSTPPYNLSPLPLHRKENLDYVIPPLIVPNKQSHNIFALVAKQSGWVTLYENNNRVLEHYIRQGEWYFADAKIIAVAGNSDMIEVITLSDFLSR